MGMYGLARRYLPASASLVAAALWVYAPSRLQDVWNVGNLSGIIGTALVPWVFLVLARAGEQPGERRAAALGLAFAALILAHQPTTVLAALFIVPGAPVMSLWAARRDRNSLAARMLTVGGGLALGGGLSLIFSLPLFAELGYIKASLPATDIPSVLLSNFLPPGELFIQPRAPDLSDLSRRLPDTLGLVGGLLGGLGWIALIWKRCYGLALAWGVALAACLFLLIEASFGVWLAVPLLDQLRFPARVLRVAVVFIALLSGASLLLVPHRYALIAAGILLVIVVGAALPTIQASRALVDFTGLTARDEIEYELETYAFGGTSYNEFKPVWATRTPYDQPPDTERYATDPFQLDFIDPGLPDVQIEAVGDTTFRIQTGSAFDLQLRHFYFPGWSAWVDGAAVNVFPTTDRGLLTLHVPAGAHTVMLAYTGTPVENLAPWLTLVSLLMTAVLYWKGCPAPPLDQMERVSDSVGQGGEVLSPRFAALVVAGVVGFTALNTLYIAPQTDWFRQRSPLAAPAAMQTPVGLHFGDAYQLLGYTLDRGAAAPGDAFRVTLFWRALRPLDRHYRPQVQLVNPRQTEAWATSEGFFVGSSPILHTPDYFVSDLHLPRLFDDAPPYVGQITVKLIDSLTDEPLRLPGGSTAVTLDQTVRVTGNGMHTVQSLDASFGSVLDLWCASAAPEGDRLRVDLVWHIRAPYPAGDLRTFVHGLDAGGQLVEQADGPPFAGDYAPQDWLPGQTLADGYTLPNDPAITQVAVGLYLPGGDRLAATHDGQPVPDNRIIVPVGAAACGA